MKTCHANGARVTLSWVGFLESRMAIRPSMVATSTQLSPVSPLHELVRQHGGAGQPVVGQRRACGAAAAMGMGIRRGTRTCVTDFTLILLGRYACFSLFAPAV
jgi:hypothetical protein